MVGGVVPLGTFFGSRLYNNQEIGVRDSTHVWSAEMPQKLTTETKETNHKEAKETNDEKEETTEKESEWECISEWGMELQFAMEAGGTIFELAVDGHH